MACGSHFRASTACLAGAGELSRIVVSGGSVHHPDPDRQESGSQSGTGIRVGARLGLDVGFCRGAVGGTLAGKREDRQRAYRRFAAFQSFPQPLTAGQ